MLSSPQCSKVHSALGLEDMLHAVDASPSASGSSPHTTASTSPSERAGDVALIAHLAAEARKFMAREQASVTRYASLQVCLTDVYCHCWMLRDVVWLTEPNMPGVCERGQ